MAYIHWRHHAEAVFRDYPKNCLLLHRIEVDAIFGKQMPETEPVSGRGVSNPTLSSVLTLSNKRVNTLRREIKAVERVLAHMSVSIRGEDRKRFLQCLFWLREDLAKAAAHVGISERTAKRWKKDACMLLAQELGWE